MLLTRKPDCSASLCSRASRHFPTDITEIILEYPVIPHHTFWNICQVEERCIPVDESINADEVFCTGTAVVVEPVGSITYQDKRRLIALVFMGYFRILRHFHKSLGKITLVWKVNLKFCENSMIKKWYSRFNIKKKKTYRGQTRALFATHLISLKKLWWDDSNHTLKYYQTWL